MCRHRLSRDHWQCNGLHRKFCSGKLSPHSSQLVTHGDRAVSDEQAIADKNRMVPCLAIQCRESTELEVAFGICCDEDQVTQFSHDDHLIRCGHENGLTEPVPTSLPIAGNNDPQTAPTCPNVFQGCETTRIDGQQPVRVRSPSPRRRIRATCICSGGRHRAGH